MTACPDSEKWDGASFMADLRRAAVATGIPTNGSLELTCRCNFRCAHCYARVGGGAETRELSAPEWCDLVDQIAETGCLSLLLTGGEPLLRPDFAEIYRHIKLSGFFATVFTNASMIDGSVVDLFVDLPPKSVEVTVYGASEQTYRAVTGVDGMFAKVVAGVDALLERGIPVKIKTVAMTLNRHEVGHIRAFARTRGLPFHVDGAIFPRLDGDLAPLALRLAPHELVAIEFDDQARLDQWCASYQGEEHPVGTGRLFMCGAGTTGFHISAAGRLQPCMMTPWLGRDLRRSPFMDAWQDLRREVSGIPADASSDCRDCEKKNLCGYCPALFRLENGSAATKSDFLCSIGSERYDSIVTQLKGEGVHHVASEPARKA